jgi:dienelactone hydrolase
MAEFEPISDGDSTARAYVDVPEGARAGVVVLHAWWGLNDDVVTYADRLVKAGYAVIAPDMFHGRVATERADAECAAVDPWLSTITDGFVAYAEGRSPGELDLIDYAEEQARVGAND